MAMISLGSILKVLIEYCILHSGNAYGLWSSNKNNKKRPKDSGNAYDVDNNNGYFFGFWMPILP